MKKVSNWFTLIELLVWMAIIMILFIWASNINFNNATDKEFLNSFTNRVSSTIEKRRNDALIGRSFSSSLIVPETYRITISTSSSGTLTSEYSTWWAFISIPEDTLDLKLFESISRISCYTPNLTNSWNTASVNIEMNKNTLTSSGCTTWWAIVEIQTSYKALNQSIFINTLTGRIEKK